MDSDLYPCESFRSIDFSACFLFGAAFIPPNLREYEVKTSIKDQRQIVH